MKKVYRKSALKDNVTPSLILLNSSKQNNKYIQETYQTCEKY